MDGREALGRIIRGFKAHESTLTPPFRHPSDTVDSVFDWVAQLERERDEARAESAKGGQTIRGMADDARRWTGEINALRDTLDRINQDNTQNRIETEKNMQKHIADLAALRAAPAQELLEWWLRFPHEHPAEVDLGWRWWDAGRSARVGPVHTTPFNALLWAYERARVADASTQQSTRHPAARQPESSGSAVAPAAQANGTAAEPEGRWTREAPTEAGYHWMTPETGERLWVQHFDPEAPVDSGALRWSEPLRLPAPPTTREE